MIRRGNNAERPDFIIDRQDWQGRNKRLARGPYETQGTLVLGMIHGRGMTVHCHREGKEKEAAQKPDDSKTAEWKGSIVALHRGNLKDGAITCQPCMDIAMVR